jgi:hypothetical protein
VPFTIKTRQATGTAIWQKRNEMCLKVGATLMPEPPLNKDGSLGFAAKMGTQLPMNTAIKFKIMSQQRILS